MNLQTESNINPLPPAEDEDEIDLLELLAVLVASKWLIALITLLSLLAGVAYTYIATPIFSADSLIQLPSKASSGALAGLSFLGGGIGKSPLDTEKTILESRLVIGQVINELRLHIHANPHYFPLLGKAFARRHDAKKEGIAAPPFNFAFYNLERYAWGGEQIQVDTLEVPNNLLGKRLTLIAEEQGFYRLINPSDGKTIIEGQVGQESSSMLEEGPLTIHVSQLTARPGTEFTVVQQTQLSAIQGLQHKLDTGKQKGSNLITISLQGPDPKKLVVILNSVLKIYLRINSELSELTGDDKTIKFLQQRLVKVERQLERAETALKNFNSRHGSINATEQTTALLAEIVSMETNILGLKQKREGLVRRFTPAHNSIIVLDAQVARFTKRLAKLNRSTRSLPGMQQKLMRLSRKIATKVKLYALIVGGLERLATAKASTTGTARIIDPPVVPSKSNKPKKKLIVILALVLGLFLGVLAAFLRHAIGGIKDPELLERQFGLPVYAAVPHSRSQKRLTRWGKHPHSVLAAIKAKDLAIDSLRHLRTSLSFALIDAKNNIVLITGPNAGTGKSFVSVNLAAVLASTGKQVLVIDADLRQGSMHHYFGFTPEPGLTDIISEGLSLEEAIHTKPIENLSLDVLTTGKTLLSSAELLMHKHFSDALAQLSGDYDYVILDAPAILAATDAAILGRLAGITLMVLKSGMHSVREIADSIKRLSQLGVKPHGIVFNEMAATKRRRKY